MCVWAGSMGGAQVQPTCPGTGTWGTPASLLGASIIFCSPCKVGFPISPTLHTGKLKLKHQLELRDGPPDPQATELGGPSGPAWSSHAEVPWLSPTHSCDRFPLL